jgi:hypothetical protein
VLRDFGVLQRQSRISSLPRHLARISRECPALVLQLSAETIRQVFPTMVALEHLLFPVTHLPEAWRHIFIDCTISLVTLQINIELILGLDLPNLRSTHIAVAYVDSQSSFPRKMDPDSADALQKLSTKPRFFCLGIDI